MASSNSPAPQAMPMPAETHRQAEVVRPRTLMPSLMIAPAPRKPMPVMIWAAMRLGSTRRPVSPAPLVE